MRRRINLMILVALVSAMLCGCKEEVGLNTEGVARPATMSSGPCAQGNVIAR